MKKINLIAISFSISMLFSVQAFSKTWAIIVGISDYSHLPKLKFASKDAEYFYRFLMATEAEHGAVDRISVFLNGNASRTSIVLKFYEIDSLAQPGDRVFIYFAGHGDSEMENGGLLLLGGMNSKNYQAYGNEFLDMPLFNLFLMKMNNRMIKTIFISDACRSGALIGGETGKFSTLKSLQEAWKKQVYMLSCQPDELSMESPRWGGGHGLFSYYLVTGLSGLADKNMDSIITLYELDKYLKDSVGQKSEMSQIPVLTGDLKESISRYNSQSYIYAKKEINKSNNEGDIVFKGYDEETILQTILDSTAKQQFKLFLQYRKNDQITNPEYNCALSVFRKFPVTNENRIAIGYMKMYLIDKLQEGFEELLAYLYQDRLEQFPFEQRFEITSSLQICIGIVGTNHYLYKELLTKQLFLEATDASTGIVKGAPNDIRLQEALRDGINKLKQAIKYNPDAPYLHLRIGDYFLHARSYEAAIRAYQIYSYFLPNDEYAANKLGYAYYLTNQPDKAEASFVKALKLNPNFFQAQENLLILKRKIKK